MPDARPMPPRVVTVRSPLLEAEPEQLAVEQASLFDAAVYAVALAAAAPTPAQEPGQDARRTARQLRAITRGEHPLNLISGGVAMHPDANGTTATKTNAARRPLRCGTCRWREPGQYPKCLWRDTEGYAARCSHSGATDCRSWWPACLQWEPKGVPETSTKAPTQ